MLNKIKNFITKFKYIDKRYFSNFNNYITNEEYKNNKIIKFFNQFKLEYKIRPTGQICLKHCQFCNKPHKNKLDNLYTLNFKLESGVFYCFRCGNNGNWYDFVGNVLQTNGLTTVMNSKSNIDVKENNIVVKIKEAKDKLDRAVLNFRNISSSDNILIKYLTEERGLNIDTLIKYNIGLDNVLYKNDNQYIEVPSIFFPMYIYDKEKKSYEFLKYKNKGLSKKYKMYQKLFHSGLPVAIFGLNTLENNNKLLIITEGEYDAMSIYQTTKIPTISLPNGASNFPIELKEITDMFKTVILWMDFDEAGQINLEKFSEKIGVNKTHLVRIDNYCLENNIKDANDLLLKNPENIINLINKSKPVPRDNLISFSNLRELVKDRIIYGLNYKGVESLYFPFFNKFIKGLRRGELTILTGQTGSGKTTFLSQYSLDFARSGVSTLWCSFELKNEVIISTMLSQFANKTIDKDNFEEIANEFQELPMLFQTFFGSTEIEKVISTIEYAIYAYDINHIILDNLQFMISGQGKGFEKFEIQDEIISKLRKLATNKNIHITLVIHPRKSDETQDLSVSSIFGTAKSTQESDNIYIIQSRDKYKVIDIKKNRFDGEVGKIALWFDKETKRFLELKINEIEQLMEGKNLNNMLKKKRENLEENEKIKIAKLQPHSINLNDNKFVDEEEIEKKFNEKNKLENENLNKIDDYADIKHLNTDTNTEMSLFGLNGQTIDVDIKDTDTCDDVLEKQLKYFEKNDNNEKDGVFKYKDIKLEEPNFYDEVDEAPNYSDIKKRLENKVNTSKNHNYSNNSYNYRDLDNEIYENFIINNTNNKKNN